MARLTTSGFEINSLLSSGTGSQVLADGFASVASTRFSFDTTVPRSGTRCLKCAPNADQPLWAVGASGLIALGTHVYARTYFRWNGTTPSARCSVFGIGNSSVVLNSSGQLELWRATPLTGAQVGSASAALSADTWYRIELREMVTTAAAATGQLELRLDGSVIASSSTETLGQSDAQNRVGAYSSGNIPAGPEFYFDDIATNDSSGASQNTWPGDGKVVLLSPVSDASRTSGWFAGVAGTSNLFAAVDNTPPVGVAEASMSITSQISAASATISQTYETDTRTYTAAGIGASDTINVIQTLANHGEGATTTGTKTGNLDLSSNPSGSSSGTFNYGGDTGAAGTYPSVWVWVRGVPLYGSTPTLGTGARIRLTTIAGITATRKVFADFLGVYVDYTLFVAGAAEDVFPYVGGGYYG